MARPKPFSYEQFEKQLNSTIDLLVEQKKCLSEEYRTDIRVEEIARHFNVNVVTLRRWCKEHTRKSPSQYIAEYRIEKAKHMLRQGIKPAVVSNMLGYTEPKIFCSVFKRYEKITPTQLI